MEFLRPASWSDALAAKAEQPAAAPLAGGTDLMVEINFDRRRPEALLDLNPISELADWALDGDQLVLGATLPYTRVITELGDQLPGLAMASRTIGSPQIRNRGSIGGNLGSASPAGDSHPVLLALNAVVEVASARGSRLIPVDEFYLRPKRSALAPDELIRAVRIPVGAGPCQFAKVGTRNAMVIAVCSFALALHPVTGSVRTGIGSAAPTPLRAPDAEAFLAGELDSTGHWESRDALRPEVAARFGELVAQAASPIDDVRGVARYRRQALAVLARRTLTWAWQEYRACA
ncbi:MAG TPA: FAD binding domain-containing protein [Jatrophihabitans sp.]|jgi:CO/xanthine dehydrogenase FAD-binding subunit|uniref:FAD binding domain-containing protein n=1 Tax=Jatrophihabitans sp. TaxID=1932789 RepID=UPI002EE611C1